MMGSSIFKMMGVKEEDIEQIDKLISQLPDFIERFETVEKKVNEIHEVLLSKK